jgi:hypothetical protein
VLFFTDVSTVIGWRLASSILFVKDKFFCRLSDRIERKEILAFYSLDYIKTGNNIRHFSPDEPSRTVLLACLKSGLLFPEKHTNDRPCHCKNLMQMAITNFIIK